MSDVDQKVQEIQQEAKDALGGETILHAIAKQSTLQEYLDTLRALVEEAQIHFGGHGFRASVVDPANVAMYHNCTLAPRAFEAFDSPGQVSIGANLERFDELLGPASADQLVELSVNMETRKLNLRYGEVEQSMALIDPDTIREEPDTSELDLQNEFVIEGRQFQQAVTACDLTSDQVAIEGRPDERAVSFVARGDDDETVVTYSDDDVIDASVQGADESLLSLSYLVNMSKVIPDDAEVTFRFDEEHPVTFDYSAVDGALEVEAMVAPRIRT